MPRDTTQMKGHRWFAAVYDRLSAPGDRDTREELAGGAAGKVLEIGAGTGLNFPYYTDRAEEILAIEPDPHMLKRAVALAEHAPRPIELRQARAEDLPFEDDSFDTAVAGWVMCTVEDLPKSLAEIRRVLKPGGEFRFVEHVRSGNALLARSQDLFTPVSRFIGAGCRPNRDTRAAIESAGFEFKDLVNESAAPPIPPLLFYRPQIRGVAVKLEQTPDRMQAQN